MLKPGIKNHSTPRLTPVVLDALAVDGRHAHRVTALAGIDVLWVAESVREAREVIEGLGANAAVLDLTHPLEDPRALLGEIASAGGDAFTVVVTATDAPAFIWLKDSLKDGAFLCRSSRIRELPKLLREISDAWS